MKSTHYIGFLFLTLLVAGSCSPQKDHFLNRNFHALNTRYNVLFNGRTAFEKGLADLEENHQDNYWERLPLEPLYVQEVTDISKRQTAEDIPNAKVFDLAEEKAVKAIQKHSMLLKGRERNPQIDDAYLLLGKARYYSGRFVPALEAFDFILENYPEANLAQEAQIWHAKTRLRLRNPRQALLSMRKLLDDSSLSPESREPAHTVMAMAYLQTDSIPEAIAQLYKATETAYNKSQTARNLMVLGQLYREQQVLDSSNITFERIHSFKKFPEKYRIHARMEQAKNTVGTPEASPAAESLKTLLKNSDNQAYFGEIYYLLAQLENKEETKIALLKKSASSSKKNGLQQQRTFETLGSYYFDRAAFVTAGAYYDSILQGAPDQNNLRIRRLNRKRERLNEVIKNETIAAQNDSILGLVAMNPEKQVAFFKEHIAQLLLWKAAKETADTPGSDKTFDPSNWYFYNATTLAYGRAEFRRIWGNRPLEDNWRTSDRMAVADLSVTPVEKMEDTIVSDPALNLDYYLKSIPTDSTEIAAIRTARNQAYYRLGLLYIKQFNRPLLAASKLEALQQFRPGEKLELPTKYQLYKIYQDLQDERALVIKNDILNNHASSTYAYRIGGQDFSLADTGNTTPEKVYAAMFLAYKAKQFDQVIEKAAMASLQFEGEKLVPKFELLKAYAIGKQSGPAAFKEALDLVAVNYPDTEEGKKAMELINDVVSINKKP